MDATFSTHAAAVRTNTYHNGRAVPDSTIGVYLASISFLWTVYTPFDAYVSMYVCGVFVW